jgi:hypothetical protein
VNHTAMWCVLLSAFEVICVVDMPGENRDDYAENIRPYPTRLSRADDAAARICSYH